jgi:hypothetical protein
LLDVVEVGTARKKSWQINEVAAVFTRGSVPVTMNNLDDSHISRKKYSSSKSRSVYRQMYKKNIGMITNKKYKMSKEATSSLVDTDPTSLRI